MAPTQIILFSNPRTACHLLERILTSQQTEISKLYHPTEPAVGLVNSASFSTPSEANSGMSTAAEYEEEIQKGVIKWREALEKADQEERILYVHTHPFYNLSPTHLAQYATTAQPTDTQAKPGNFSLIPDNVLLHGKTLPIFTIRHPVLLVPSLIRALEATWPGEGRRETFLLGTALGFSRELYDWYKSNGVDAIVADADDFITNEKYVHHLAQTVGLDPSRVAFSWSKTSEEDRESMGPVLLNIQHTLVESKGPESDRAARNLDLDAERQKWKAEFSEDMVALIEELVEITMPQYEYLRERRLMLKNGY